MSKIVDENSFWFIKHNPLSKEQVVPYLGRQISDECIPDKIYMIYRPASTLRESVDSWNNPPKPLIEDHTMLGEGFESIDNRPVQGVISNVEFDEKDGILYGDISVYSESLKDTIANGKKELSLGYFTKYEKRPGVWNNQAYDYVQTSMTANHCAIVDVARAGADVRVYDSKCVMDSLDINPTDFTPTGGDKLNKNEDNDTIKNEQTIDNQQGSDEMADKREAIREIMAIAAKPASEFKGGDEEKVETIAKLLEKSEYAPSETKKADDGDDTKEEKTEEKKTEDKCGKDEDVDKRHTIREIMAIAAKPADEFKGGDTEKVETIAKLLENSEYNKSERGTANDDLSELIMGIRAINEKLDKLAEKKVLDEKEEEEEKEEEKKASEDSALFEFGSKESNPAEDAALKDYLA